MDASASLVNLIAGIVWGVSKIATAVTIARLTSQARSGLKLDRRSSVTVMAVMMHPSPVPPAHRRSIR